MGRETFNGLIGSQMISISSTNTNSGNHRYDRKKPWLMYPTRACSRSLPECRVTGLRAGVTENGKNAVVAFSTNMES